MTSSAHATPRRREGHPREMVDVAWRLKRPPERHSRSRSARAEVPPRPGGPRSRPRGRSRLLRADARTPGKLKSDSAAGAGSPVEGRRRRRRRRGPTPPPGGRGRGAPRRGPPPALAGEDPPPPPGRAHLLPPPTRRPPSGPTPLASEPVGGWDGEDRAGDGLTLSGS